MRVSHGEMISCFVLVINVEYRDENLHFHSPVSQSRQPTFGENPLFENKTLLREARYVVTCSELPFRARYTRGRDELVSFQI